MSSLFSMLDSVALGLGFKAGSTLIIAVVILVLALLILLFGSRALILRKKTGIKPKSLGDDHPKPVLKIKKESVDEQVQVINKTSKVIQPKPASKLEPKPEPKPVPMPEPKPEPKPVSKSEPKPELKSVPKPEFKPEPKPKLEKIPESKLVAPAPGLKEEPVPTKVEILEESISPRESKKEIPQAKGLGAALLNTRSGFMAKLSRLFSRGQAEISDEDFEEMETILFTADIGAKTAQKLLDGLKKRVREEDLSGKAALEKALKEEMLAILKRAKTKNLAPTESLSVYMFVGVNGAGKTTSIGKLGAQMAESGKKVFFGAGDTFRAAAVKQLSIWGERAGITVVTGKENADSAAVLFDAITEAKKAHADVVLCDTAGRLHTKVGLMDELKKVHRVLAKAESGAPHEVFLVIDATMGQNAIAQAREFAEATPLTGVVLSKLDGTAKGGVALGIVDELEVPIRFVGVGEQLFDLKPFDADEFVNALFSEN